QVKSLNYLNNILAKIEAIDAGVLEALMLNQNGEVAECTGDNIFIIKDGNIATPPISAGILDGITRRLVIDEIAPALGYKIEQRTIMLKEVLDADEVFLTGTAAEVIGVSHIDEQVVGCGKVGKITHALEDQFRKIVAQNAPED
ncbi:MAG: aminotransferase class IV, partial [Phycisphaerales bacterium]|nr:aminotransferase class IV [Phycisphaerales bacterium]